MNKPRKPTEIVVYTDSFCYSCCAFTTKSFKEHGSVILVGFDGDPTKDGVNKFEVGQSPTAVIDMNDVFKNIYLNKLISSGINHMNHTKKTKTN